MFSEPEGQLQRENSLKALVVDDNCSAANLISDIFTSLGFKTVLTALDGETALRFFNNEEPDIVVTDFIMPRIDGIALFREMRRLRPKVPVVIFTAFSDQLDARLQREKSAPEFVLKKYALKVEDFVFILEKCFPGRMFKFE